MRKLLRVLAVVLGLVLVLVIALFVLARVLITPERVRALVLPKAEAALNRPVDLENVEISLFSGIVLTNLTVQERSGSETFIAAERAVLRYKLWPLLFRRVVVDEVRLIGPRLRVERLADGSFNFSDLLQESEPKGAVPPPEEEEKGAPIDLLVSQVVLENGELLFLDHTFGGQAPLRYELAALEVSASDISLQQAFPFKAGARLGEGSLAAEGTIDPQALRGKVSASIKALDLALFAPYYQEKVPGRVNALKLSLDVSAEGGREALRSEGRIALEPIDLLLDRQGKEPLAVRNAALSLDYRILLDQVASLLTIEQATVTANGIPLQISGKVENYAAAPRVDLLAVLPALQVSKALAAVPPEFVADIAELGPAGEVSARMRLAGPVDQPEKLLQEGEVNLSPVKAQVSGAQMEVKGTLRLKGDALNSENLQVMMGENRATIDLRAENLMGEVIRVTSAVKADRFALDPLLQATAAPAGAAGQTPEKKKEAPQPLDLPLLADGTVQIGETLYKGLQVRDFDLKYRLEKNVLTVQRLQGKIAQGSFGVNAVADLGKIEPTYQARLNLKGIQADPLLTAFWPKMAGTVFGSLDYQGSLEGKGTEEAAIKRNLSSVGEFAIRDGQLTGAGLVQGLAEFLNLEELRVLRFSEAAGNVAIKKGKLLLDSAINGKDLRLNPKGTIGLENYALDLALNLRLAPAMADRLGSKVTRFLSDQQGWTQLPVKVAGTIDSPRFSLDTTAVGERAREKVGEEIRGRLQKELDRRLPDKGDQSSPEPGAPGLEETLRGLFGK